MEPKLVLIVSERDKEAAAQLLPDCEREYEERMKAATGREFKCKLQLHDSAVLNPKMECGGLTLESEDGRIVCMNTVNSKLNLVYEQLLPQIRQLLFPPK